MIIFEQSFIIKKRKRILLVRNKGIKIRQLNLNKNKFKPYLKKKKVKKIKI